jgi:hypothetical protein
MHFCLKTAASPERLTIEYRQGAPNSILRSSRARINLAPTQSTVLIAILSQFLSSDFRIIAAASCRGVAWRRRKSQSFGTTTGPTSDFKSFRLPHSNFRLQIIPTSAFRLPTSYHSPAIFTGSAKRNVAPCPGRLSNVIFPPRQRARIRAPARPRPCPLRGTMEHSLTWA